MTKSPAALSDSELVSILISKGTREKSAVDLARDVLRAGKNNLNELAKLSIKDLQKIKGIGLAKAISIAAALELGRRRQTTALFEKTTIQQSRDIAEYLQARFRDLPHEVFAVIFLNRANKVKHFEVVSQGGITGTVADPRIILKKAIEEEAVSIILCHNHPSGSLKPSRADEELTQRIKEAASLLDIRVIDHIIVSEGGYYSFADDGLI
jgi:DNA repair protein RadC